MRDKLAIELMEKLDNKYNMTNVISLDEYVYEYDQMKNVTTDICIFWITVNLNYKELRCRHA